MKKILVAFALLLVMSGCDGASEMDTDTLSCRSSNTANGVTNTTSYDIEYEDNDVKFVTITFDYTQDNVNDVDGVDADTDGTTENNTNNNNGNVNSDNVIDGVVGDVVDGAVEGVTETILDIAGIKNTYENQMSTYDNIEGLTYNVDIDNNSAYRVVYKIDLDKISDTDLARFNVTRDLSDIRTNYEDLGYTCK